VNTPVDVAVPITDVTEIVPLGVPGIRNITAEEGVLDKIICGIPPIVTDCRQPKF
jgi:hypothetical protein